MTRNRKALGPMENCTRLVVGPADARRMAGRLLEWGKMVYYEPEPGQKRRYRVCVTHTAMRGPTLAPLRIVK